MWPYYHAGVGKVQLDRRRRDIQNLLQSAKALYVPCLFKNVNTKNRTKEVFTFRVFISYILYSMDRSINYYDESYRISHDWTHTL